MDDEYAAEGPDELEDADGFDNAPAPPARADGATAEHLQGLVHYIAAALIDTPDEVEVDVVQHGASVHLTLRVPESELGKVIGRQGRIARAIRTALMIAGSREHVRATLDIEG